MLRLHACACAAPRACYGCTACFHALPFHPPICFGQVSVRRGMSRQWDHAQLVHEQWSFLAVNAIDVHVVRVGTEDNIADIPSREAGTPQVCHRLNATHVQPTMPEHATDEDTWAVLQERWRLVDDATWAELKERWRQK